MFFGIIIRMYVSDHNPPHFHAQYQDFKAIFDFDGGLLRGSMPKAQVKLIAAWCELHKAELLANWQLGQEEQSLFKIEPLR